MKMLLSPRKLKEHIIGCADEGGASFAIDALRTSAHPTTFTVTIKALERYPKMKVQAPS